MVSGERVAMKKLTDEIERLQAENMNLRAQVFTLTCQIDNETLTTKFIWEDAVKEVDAARARYGSQPKAAPNGYPWNRYPWNKQ